MTTALLPEPLDKGEFGAGVAAGQLFLRRLDRDGAAADRPDDFNQVGQVVFALDVVVADTVEQIDRLATIDRHQAAIAIGDAAFFLGCILMLADRNQRAIFHDQPAITGRVGSLKPDNDHVVASGKAIARGLQRLRRDQRRIAEDNQDVVKSF